MSFNKPYRANVGVVLFNSEGLVLAGERIWEKDSWQFVQGGKKKKESAKDALWRELYEEIGIKKSLHLIAVHPTLLTYNFPKNLNTPLSRKYKGQEQQWFLVYWNGKISDCRLDVDKREFRQVKWMPYADLLSQIYSAKKDVYEKVYNEFSAIIKVFLKNL